MKEGKVRGRKRGNRGWKKRSGLNWKRGVCMYMSVWSTTLIYCHSHDIFYDLCVIIVTIIIIVAIIHYVSVCSRCTIQIW